MPLREDIEHAINCNSAENGSNTPDFILAEFLTDCLAAYNKALVEREKRKHVRWIIWNPEMPESFAATTPKDAKRIASQELGEHWKAVSNAGWRCTHVTLGGEDEG